MALVAYDYSDSSDIEDVENEKATKILTVNKSVEGQFTKETEEQDKNTEDITFKSDQSIAGESLFNLLPQPSIRKSAVVEEDDEFLHKKENQNSIFKPKAKITVPSLSDFKDVEGTVPHAKPRAPTGKKSGLLSMLPQPRNAVSKSTTTKSFVPHILTKKPETTLKKQSPLPSSAKQLRSQIKSFAKDSDESDDDEVQNDFFSIHKTDELLVEDIPLDLDKPNAVSLNVATSNNKPTSNIQSYFKQDIVTEQSELNPNNLDNTEESHRPYAATEGYETSEAQASNSNEPVLDEEAIMKLCGTRGKRKREEIQIVDVNQKEVLADAREWLLKGLMDDTTKRVSASKRRGDEPTSQQRRKHQITYLAHQAKANEAELQNQWANNRVSKRQTQSKYGF